MHLTQFSDYSLRLLLYLAEHDDRSCTIGEIAAWYDISKAHLVKAAHALATLGFVKSFQGRGGGLRLGKPAAEIDVASVLKGTEPDFILVECFDRARNNCRIARACKLKHALYDAHQAFLNSLSRHSLADLVSPEIPSPQKRRVS